MFLNRLFRAKARRPEKPPGGFAFSGPYASWKEAEEQSDGYSSEDVINAVESAMREVEAGAAAMERDGVAMAEPQYPFPLIAALLDRAFRDRSRLSVLDFGGSLGSTFRSTKPWLEGIPDLKWGIVEQKHFVRRGREFHSTPNLHFFEDIEGCSEALHPNVVVLSGVLMYLQDVDTILKNICSTGAGTIILDRTLVSADANTRIFVEHVNMPSYSTSYPCVARPIQDIECHWLGHYNKIANFEPVDRSPDAPGSPHFFGGIYRLSSEKS